MNNFLLNLMITFRKFPWLESEKQDTQTNLSNIIRPDRKLSRLQNSKFSGVKAWNELTNELMQASFYRFKKDLKKLLLNATKTD